MNAYSFRYYYKKILEDSQYQLSENLSLKASIFDFSENDKDEKSNKKILVNILYNKIFLLGIPVSGLLQCCTSDKKIYIESDEFNNVFVIDNSDLYYFNRSWKINLLILNYLEKFYSNIENEKFKKFLSTIEIQRAVILPSQDNIQSDQILIMTGVTHKQKHNFIFVIDMGIGQTLHQLIPY